MSVSPLSDFWPPLGGTGLSGVFYATPPLFINANTMAISDATDVQPGAMTILNQPFAGVKDFTDGIKLSSGQLVTEISTDATFAAASDSKLATQKAIKDYVDTTGGLIDSVVDPLTLNLGVLDINDASAVQPGVVSIGAQSIAGAKTFTSRAIFSSGLDANDDIKIAASPAEVVSNSGSVELRLRSGVGDYSGSNSALVAVYPAASATEPNGIRNITGDGGVFRVMNSPGALIPPTNLMDIHLGDANIRIPTWIWSTTAPQFTLKYDILNYADFSVTNAGDMTINCSGNDLNLHTSDRVHVNNVANCTGPTTGALQVDGGLYVNLDEYVRDVHANSLVTPMVTTNELIVNGTSPRIRSTGGTNAFELFTGNAPYNPGNSSRIAFNWPLDGMHLDLRAATGASIRIYASATPVLTMVQQITASLFNVLQTVDITSPTAYQLSLSYAPGAKSEFAVDVTGNLTIKTTPGDVYVDASNVVRVLSIEDASSSADGAFHTNGGLSASKHIYAGTALHAPRLFTANANDATQISLNNTSTVSEATISMDSSNNVKMTMAGTLLVNGASFLTIATTTVIHNLLGAIGGTVRIVYAKIGNTVTATFQEVERLSTVADVIGIDSGATPIPAGYRPYANEVRGHVIIDNNYEQGMIFIGSAGTIVFWKGLSSPGNFTNGVNVGWRRFTMSWSLAST